MTNKHQPETPLPFVADEKTIITNREKSGRIHGRFEAKERISDGIAAKDAAYLAHAANAYPKLVEALRAIVAENEAAGSGNKSLTVADADILLRELGEA